MHADCCVHKMHSIFHLHLKTPTLWPRLYVNLMLSWLCINRCCWIVKLAQGLKITSDRESCCSSGPPAVMAERVDNGEFRLTTEINCKQLYIVEYCSYELHILLNSSWFINLHNNFIDLVIVTLHKVIYVIYLCIIREMYYSIIVR